MCEFKLAFMAHWCMSEGLLIRNKKQLDISAHIMEFAASEFWLFLQNFYFDLGQTLLYVKNFPFNLTILRFLRIMTFPSEIHTLISVL